MNMIRLLTLIIFCSFTQFASAQKPSDGTYIYDVAFEEWNGKSNGATCVIKIMGDSIYVIHNGGNMTGKKGDILESGIIMKHSQSGKWIIAHKAEDVNAKEIGACSGGPTIIDFKRKKYWSC
ncbi:MAG: hypothetical protein IPP51_17695 [Bacteroidetes bacterium]|nr:hypothetical protein [Bacteroidota bacterium]